MLEQKTTGVTEYAAEQAARGSGKLGLTTDYMLADPVTYYHNKFSKEGSKYFNEAMWSEAARRGESEALISSLLKNADKTNEVFNELNEYSGRMDYDTYMLALEAPFLDDTKEVERIADNGVSFGKYTDKQWAVNVLKSTIEKYDAEIIQEQKENQGFLSKAFWTVVTGLDKMVVGVARAGQDWVNIIQGLGNVITGKDFLAAFADDEGELFNEIAQGLDLAIYEYQRNYTNVVNAVDAYEAGYRPGVGKTFAEQVDNAVGVGAGYTTWGKWMNAMTDSIGYMLPTMLLTIPTGGASTFAQFGAKGAAKVAGVSAKTAAAIKNGLFYAQIFSGMVGENVETAMANGATIDQINHAEIISNAALKAVAQWGVEKALGAIMGFSGLDRLMGATAAKGATGLSSKALETGAKIAQQAGRTGIKAFGTAIGRIGKDLLKEGLEETLQDMSDGILDTIYGGSYAIRGKETLSINNLLDSFIVGAMTAGVTGAFSGASVIWNRDAMIDNDGKAYKLGVFQQMNYNEAMKTMSDWSATLNDTTASAQEKADAAFKLNAAMSTLGNIFKTFGTERTQKALELLTVYQESTDKKKVNEAKERLSDVGYAKSLLADFRIGQTKANLQYIKETALEKVQKALEKKSDKLKAANVTKIDNIITEDINPNDPEISISKEAATDLKAALKELGISVLVGHDGNIVTRSGEVVFANDSLIRSGDVTTILKGITYDVAVEAYKNAMDSRQKQFLLDHYKQLTNNENATIENAVTALLFDKDFYCYMLLKTKEKAKPSTLFNNRSLQLLATMDKVVKGIASNENVKGRLSAQAYKLLISKIQENMKTGLFTFATQYAYIDLANVSKEIVGDTDLSALRTAIKMNKNVQFTETVNHIFSSSENKVIANDKITAFDNIIDKYIGQALDSEINEAKAKIRSAKYSDRADARTFLIFLASRDYSDQSKLTYLPTYNQPNMDALNVRENIANIESQFGASWNDIINGNIDTTQIPLNTQNYLTSNGYDLTNKYERLSMLDELLWNVSGHTLGVGGDGSIMQIVDKENLIKPEYLTTEGGMSLFNKIASDSVTVQDICSQSIDPRLGNIKLAIDESLLGTNLRGYFSPDKNTIFLSNTQIIDNIMHELTHGAQDLIAKTSTKEQGQELGVILGGSENIFALMKDSEAIRLYKYLQDNFSLSYEYMKSKGATDPEIAYFMLAGELQANVKMTSRMFETGFRFNADRTKLISPTGDITFDLTIDIKKLDKAREAAKKQAQLIDKARKLSDKGVLKLLADILKQESRTIGDEVREELVQLKSTLDYQLKHYGEMDNYTLTRYTNLLKQNVSDKTTLNKINTAISDNLKLRPDLEAAKPLGRAFEATTTEDLRHTALKKPGEVGYTPKGTIAKTETKPIAKSSFVQTTTEDLRHRNLVRPDDYSISKNLQVPLNKTERQRILTSAEVQEYTKNTAKALIASDGLPIIFYRGTQDKSAQMGEGYSSITGIFLSNNPLVSLEYVGALDDYGTESWLKGYVSNITAGDLYVVDAKGHDYYEIPSPEQFKLDKNSLEKDLQSAKTVFGTSFDDVIRTLKRNIDYYYKDGTMNTDLLVYAIKKFHPSKKGILFKNILESARGLDRKTPSYSFVVFNPDESLKQVTYDKGTEFIKAADYKLRRDTYDTFTAADMTMDDDEMAKAREAFFKEYDIDEATMQARIPDIQKGLRFISQKRALLSNLKYFIRKGATIQMHSGLAAFIEGTTHDFRKLPKVIRNEIEAGTLTKQKLDHYLQTTKSMNDYTYQMAAKYIFKNEAAAEISYNDMKQIQDNIQQLAAVSYVLTNTTSKTLREYGKKKLSPKEMFDLLSTIQNQIKQGNTKLEDLYAKGIQWASTVYAGKNVYGKPEYFEATEDYSDRLNLYFLRHYNGTFGSIYDINNLGKYQIMKEQPTRFEEFMQKKGNTGGTYGWTEKLKKSDIDYENASSILDATIGTTDLGVTQALDRIDRQDKINAIEDYLLKNLEAQIAKAGPEGSQARIDAAKAALPEFNKQRSQIETMSDETLNQKYLLATGAEMLEPKKAVSTEQLTKVDKTKEQIGTHITDKTRKDSIVNEAKRLRNLMGKVSPVTYRNMPADLKAVMTQAADKTLVLNDSYLKMNSQQLENLITSFKDFSNKYRALKNLTEAELGLRARTKKTKEYLQKLTDEKAKTSKDGVQAPRVDAKGNNVDTAKPKTMKEKVDIVHKVKIKEESFSFNSREQATDTVKQVLNTAWDKERMSTVKGLTNNEAHNVSNGKAFYEQNAKALSNMSLAEAEATAKWFMDAQMVNTTNDTEEYKKFSAVQLYTLGYIYGQTKNNGIFSQMNTNTKQQIENFLRTQATVAGTALSVWNNIQDKINPIEQIFKNLEIGGVELTDAEQDALVKAAEENDIEQIAKLQKQILDRIKNEKISKKGIGKQITTYRAMAMLSSPLTWLRNIVSNMMLKSLNKLSSKIGDNIWKSKQGAGQLRLLEGVKVDQKTGRIIGGTIDTSIQNFVNEHFIDNKLFDTLISDLSKYNPSDIQQKYRQPDGTINKNALFANMVLKSLYNKYYNQNMFKGKFMNSVYQGLMKMMSDNNYVREAAVRYFGKILADRKYDLSQGVTDNIMTDFANAIGIAMADYMHSDNFLNSFERIVAEKGEGWHTVYKLIMPFASSNWNWFKAAIRFSPIGLGQSIYKMIRLENTIIKAEASWAAGKSQISPEMTEYLVRRDLGSGIIGTMSLILGAALAGLGFIKLEDEDYGTPKLRIGNIKIDVSSVFGSSSLLVGAGLINGFQKKGLSFDGLLEALNNSLDIAADGFFLTDLMALDLYSNGQFSTLLNISESVLLSFIPNIVSYVAGATYFGDKKKTKFWQKLVAKIPFLANILPDKIDPYTGQTSGMLGVFNRIMPYVDINIESSQAKIAKNFGLNKKELTGKYTINDEAFNLSAYETANINKSYGEWNAKYLSEFLDNSTSYSVKDSKTGTMRMLSYNQMDGTQRSAVMKRIMNDNSKYAKILAWTNAGNQYYASETEYNELRERGITKNVYYGNKGFIKK